MSPDRVGLKEARAQLGEITNRAQYAGEVTLLTRQDKPVAAVVPLALLPPEIRAQLEEGDDEANSPP